MPPSSLHHYDCIRDLYSQESLFFPLIAAVLQHSQNGVVFVDDATQPRQAYVEHAFGFAQVFGEESPEFERNLERYLFVDKAFRPEKIRLYCPCTPSFITQRECNGIKSFRQRFVCDSTAIPTDKISAPEQTEVRIVTEENVDAVENFFGVVTRFWRTSKDFLRYANAILILRQGCPASLCYAAAIADAKAEIDVVTLPEFRNQGLAKLAASAFIQHCHRQKIQPLWDCFTNNLGSMALCRSLGFKAKGSSYPFYTIGKFSS